MDIYTYQIYQLCCDSCLQAKAHSAKCGKTAEPHGKYGRGSGGLGEALPPNQISLASMLLTNTLKAAKLSQK